MMEKILDRFLRYVSVDTQSNEESESQPSTAKQLNLLRMLRDELEAMGVEATLDEYGYVMGRIPSNIDKEVPAVGFIAHVDTAPDASGADIKPQVIPDYDGGEIALAGVPGLALKPSEFPEMLHYVGQTLITTDGTTLLGADDKGGVAEIMDAVQYIMAHPEEPSSNNVSEQPFTNEEYWMREPTPIALNAGWNHVKITLPHAVDRYNYHWVATFVPVAAALAFIAVE